MTSDGPGGPDPGSRIARLPRPLQPLAQRGKRMIGWPEPPPYVYTGDGIATVHYSPFLDDATFDRIYRRGASRTAANAPDIRWRAWILSRCALQCRGLAGSFAEFGVYRGGNSSIVLSLVDLRPDQRYYLFDTFSGIPASNLTDAEREAGFAGRLADSSVADVEAFLEAWSGTIRLVPGDVFDTLPSTETGPLAFVHLDLNASAPSKLALEYSYERLLPGGMIVCDDYGWATYEDQRAMIEAFVADTPETLIALPTGQALLTKR